MSLRIPTTKNELDGTLKKKHPSLTDKYDTAARKVARDVTDAVKHTSDKTDTKTSTPNDSESPKSSISFDTGRKLSYLQKGFNSSVDDQIKELYSKVMNTPKFSYDPKADPTYNQYAETYRRNAELATEDAMAKAAALSGGYGSSYAQAVGNQAYNEQMAHLNDSIPELRNAAYNEYKDMISMDYDKLSALLNERSYERGAYENDRTFDRSVFESDRSFDEAQRQYNNDLAYKYAALEEDRKRYAADTAETRLKTALAAGYKSWDDYVAAVGKAKADSSVQYRTAPDDFVQRARYAYGKGGKDELLKFFEDNELESSMYDIEAISSDIANSMEAGTKITYPSRFDPANNGGKYTFYDIGDVRKWMVDRFGDEDGDLSKDDENFIKGLMTYKEMSSDGKSDEYDDDEAYYRYLAHAVNEYTRSKK